MMALGAVSALFAVSACGGDDDTSSDESSDAAASDHSHDDGHDHSHDDEGSMSGDSSATVAYDIDGAEVAEAAISPLESASSETANVTGTAWLARHDAGTTVTVELTGLPPDSDFMSHLHAEACSDNGGPHFKFDPDGSDQPPNEVHLMFQSDGEGAASTTVENDNPESEGAQSIVIHHGDAKVACGDF